ncbi:hypothetical protein QBC41DRAFT_307160 [Cercophora samala]|uniref:Uncharacterized protein n=1 Tax=Cercophora samala TaxID=330535 RepID=A0AA40D486_9PEZI|nr:hypothetical protein QBC41DRAFT_307160 [Cercophora samala]
MDTNATLLRHGAMQASLKKRPADEDVNPDQVKRLKGIWKTDDKPTTLESALDELEFVKAQLASVLDFVNESGKASDLPPSLKPLLIARLGPQSLANSLKKKIRALGERLQDEVDRWKETGTTNNTIATAMIQFIKPIREISEIDHPDALAEAYGLVFIVKDWWYVMDGRRYDEGTDYEDNQMDQLLLGIVEKRKEAGHRWEWAADLEDLDGEAKRLAEYGIEPWYAESRKALRELVDGQILETS